MVEAVFIAWQVAFMLYFLGVNGGYLLLNLLSVRPIRERMSDEYGQAYPLTLNGLDIPVSILVPAYNEASVIVEAVRSFLSLDYPSYEVIVMLDGGNDDSLQRLIDAFDLTLTTVNPRIQVATQPIEAVYRTARYTRLVVARKANGGKADALNAAINLASCPLVCCVDADSLLAPDSLRRIAHTFMADPNTVAAGGTVRVANGCHSQNGQLVTIHAADSWLARFQTVEYLRAFLFGRTGFNRMQALPLISGAFGVFKKTAIVEVGGFCAGHVGEDMEIILRLHRWRIEKNKPWVITSLPDPVCWTEVPEEFQSLAAQRNRWQRGLLRNLWDYRGLLFHRKGGTLSWVTMPFLVFAEGLGPVIEFLGYIGLLAYFGLGVISVQALAAFGILALGSGIALSVSAFILEEGSFMVYTRPKDLAILLAAALLENFGYRQLTVWWRVQGLVAYLLKSQQGWGRMVRKPFE